MISSFFLGAETLIVKKDHGVDKIFWLEENVVADVTQKNIVFLVRCTVKNALAIAGTLPGLHEKSHFFLPCPYHLGWDIK